MTHFETITRKIVTITQKTITDSSQLSERTTRVTLNSHLNWTDPQIINTTTTTVHQNEPEKMNFLFNIPPSQNSRSPMSHENKQKTVHYNRFADLLNNRKVYHQAYDLCPIKLNFRDNQSSKSCEPPVARNRDEECQTDFPDPPLRFDASTTTRKDKMRRSSSFDSNALHIHEQPSHKTADTLPLDSVKDSIHFLNGKSMKNSIDSHGMRFGKANGPVFSDTINSSRIQSSFLNFEDHEHPKTTEPPFTVLKDKIFIENQEDVSKDLSSIDITEPSTDQDITPKVHIPKLFENDHARTEYLSPDAGIYPNNPNASFFDYTGKFNESFMAQPKELENQNNAKSNKKVLSFESYSIQVKPNEKQKKAKPLNVEKTFEITLEPKKSQREHKVQSESKVYSEQKPQSEHKEQQDYTLKPKVQNGQEELTGSKIKLIGDPSGKRTSNVSTIYKGDVREQIYSNHDIIDIEQLIPSSVVDQTSLNPDLVIIEGELMKYKPGMHFTYVKRWIQITQKEIRYYKSRWSANCWGSKPLMTVPFTDIKGVYRVDIKLPRQVNGESSSKATQKQNLKLYHFEIFTHDRPLPLAEELDTRAHANTPGMPYQSPINHKVLSKTPSKTDNGSDAYPRDHEKNYLMPPPPLSKLKSQKSLRKDATPDPKSKENNPKLANAPLINAKSGTVVKKNIAMQQNNSGNKGFTSPINAKVYGFSAQQEKPSSSSTKKTMYHYVKNIEDFSSWSGRHKEWYDSEKRLLFSSFSNKEREIWLSVISWLIDMSTKKGS